MDANSNKQPKSQFPFPKKVNNWGVFRTGLVKNIGIIKFTSFGVEHANKTIIQSNQGNESCIFPREINS